MDLRSANFWQTALKKAAMPCIPAIRIMEVCGTHTHAIAKNNLRALLPESVKLISGPGCPICVSGVLFIEKIRTLLRNNVTVAMFGDLLRIPGANGSLMGEKNLKLVYSPEDALTYAVENPDKEVVFAAVGFAPTLSAAAALITGCVEKKVKNFTLLSDFKEITPVLTELSKTQQLSGLLLPGHVASVVGCNYFKNLHIPAVVAGFEAENILHAIKLILDAIARNDQDYLFNDYTSAVRDNGNTFALKLIDQYFELSSSTWRGLGDIANAGWKLKDAYADFDAEKRFDLSKVEGKENPACRCGEVLTGVIEPKECPLFGKVCTPDSPAGACMSSSEGACAAIYQYQGGNL